MENNTLLSMTETYNNLMTSIMKSGGELSEDVAKVLAEVEKDLPVKVDSYAFIQDKIKAEVEFWGDRNKQIESVLKGFKNFEDALKERLKIAMKTLGKTEVDGNEFKFKLQEGGNVLVVENEKAIPSEYFETVVTAVLKKKELMQDLEMGIEIDGASLSKPQYVKKYINRGSIDKKPKKKKTK